MQPSGRGPQLTPEVVLRLKASAMENPIVEAKLLQGLILPIDKGEVVKLDPNRAITRFLHSLSQVITYFQIVLVFCIFSVLISYVLYRR